MTDAPLPRHSSDTAGASRVQLDNGLTVLVQEVHTAPLVSVWCWYGVGSRDEGIGLTGASHWVEHMNFKGTTNIPREEMKGIVERFGGMWNGYTWIDQTTYLETAGRDALDQMLFIEAERMNNSLFDPEECESERTVIISELQGGDNDPEQVLDTELTATAFRAHTYRHPTIGWLHDLQSMTRDDLYAHYRRFYVPEQRDARRRRRRRDAMTCCGRPSGISAGFPSGAAPPRLKVAEPPQLGERRVTLEREGTTAYLKFGYHAPVGDRSGLLPDAGARRGADGRERAESLVELPGRAAAAEVAACIRRSSSADWPRRSTARCSPRPIRSSTRCRSPPPRACVCRCSRRRCSRRSSRSRQGGIEDGEVARAKRQLRARLVFEDDSVTNIAHQLGYFETVVGPGFYPRLQACIDAVTADQVRDVAQRRLRRATADGRRRSSRWSRADGGHAGPGAVAGPRGARPTARSSWCRKPR